MKDFAVLASFLPATIVEELADGVSSGKVIKTLPHIQTLTTVCLFADVSGFTALSEAMQKQYGAEQGPEFLGEYSVYICGLRCFLARNCYAR